MALWDIYGFRENPYDTRPLEAKQEDIDLLVGRVKERNNFLSLVDSGNSGVIIISGFPGVGKTSFFNVLQYEIENTDIRLSGNMMAARFLCPVQPGDNVKILCLRILTNLCKSVHLYCNLNSLSIPRNVSIMNNWVNTTGTARMVGLDVGLQILGFGGNFSRTVQFPSLAEATFENFRDAIECIIDSIINELNFEGVFIALDNIENLSDSDLSNLLVSYRDTLFTIPCIWWTLIGQAGLSGLIQSLQPKVYDRISGTVELNAITLEELYEAVKRRTEKFSVLPSMKSALSNNILRQLYNASLGEIRFVFKNCTSICLRLIADTRNDLSPDSSNEDLVKSVMTLLNNNQISDEISQELLKAIVFDEITSYHLKEKEINVLRRIGQYNYARPKDYEKYGFKSTSDFLQNYLLKLLGQQLLVREQEGRIVKYRLRGISILAFQYGIL